MEQLQEAAGRAGPDRARLAALMDDEDWDPAAYDASMASAFGQDYYDVRSIRADATDMSRTHFIVVVSSVGILPRVPSQLAQITTAGLRWCVLSEGALSSQLPAASRSRLLTTSAGPMMGQRRMALQRMAKQAALQQSAPSQVGCWRFPFSRASAVLAPVFHSCSCPVVG